MASVDDIETNTAFAKKNNASFPVLSDAGKNVALAYEVMSPLGFSKRWTYYIGTDGEILKIDKDITPLSAGEDIANNLEALGFSPK